MKESIEVRIGRYLANEMGEQEKAEFQNELASNPALQEAYSVYQSIWKIKPGEITENWNALRAWEKFEVQHLDIPVISKTRRNVLYWSIAASLLLLVGAAWYFFASPNPKTHLYAENASVIELEDGSSIHLNKGSAVTVFPFNRKSRHVELSGEAFFEVSPDTKRPFTINCGKTITQVVGTSFNIRQVLDIVQLYVNSGKVIFRSASDSDNAVALIAGESAYFENNKMLVVPNPSPNVNAWHTKQLQFKSMPLIDAIHDVSEYFGQNVTIENEEIHSCKISIPLPYKDPDFKSVLTAISKTVNATLIMEGDKCIIKGGSCK